MTDFLDYSTAWAIQHEVGDTLDHDPKCSSVPGHHPLSGPAFPCDCDAVAAEWRRRVDADSVAPYTDPREPSCIHTRGAVEQPMSMCRICRDHPRLAAWRDYWSRQNEQNELDPVDQVEQRLLSTDDAAVWAREYVALHGGDEGLMITWFANAIETAKRITLEQHPERKPVEDDDFVVLPRDALFEFFGAVALPPWTDADGSLLGRTVDCAPIAQRCRDWVRQHDLGDLYRQRGE